MRSRCSSSPTSAWHQRWSSTTRCCHTSPRHDELDRVSTAGFAIGFIGGGVLLLVNLAWILQPALFGLPDVVAAMKLSLVSVGRLVAGLFDSVASPCAGAGREPRRSRRRHRRADSRRCRRRVEDIAGPAAQPERLSDARGVPALQRRHPDHHPDVVDLRHRDRHRSERTDCRVRHRPVRRGAVFVRVRRHRRTNRRQDGAVWCADGVRVHQRARLLHDRHVAVLRPGLPGRHSSRAAVRR